MDTLAILKGKINKLSIKGKWINAQNKKEYPLIIKKTNIEITSLPTNIEGKYYNETCNLTLSFFK